MLQSLLIIKDPECSDFQHAAPDQTAAEQESKLLRREQPEYTLSGLGFRTLVVRKKQDAQAALSAMDAVILCVPASQVVQWVKLINGWHSTPVLWWCDEDLSRETDLSFDSAPDGILFPQLNPTQMHWAFLLSTNRFLQRRQWHEEREQFIARMEERKWIDRAKAILCEIKNITEAEAYDFLRKQAMNERKRMTDVASSIVRVYELLRGQNQGR